MSPKDVLKAVESGEYRVIDTPSGSYFLSRNAEIYSLNGTVPRKIRTTLKTNGELIVQLYTPNVTSFDVATLVLETFVSKPKDGQAPCFKDDDPSNCCLDNLYWGDQKEQLKRRKSTALKKSRQVTSYLSRSPEISRSHTEHYYCNRAFLSDLLTYAIQCSRVLVTLAPETPDASNMRRLLNEISEITSVAVLEFERLKKTFRVSFECEELTRLTLEYSHAIIKNRAAYTSL